MPKDSTSISFAAKYEFINKTAYYPGPGQYQLPDKKEKRGIVVGRQNRFTTEHPDQVKNPGPGTYEWKRPSSANVSFTTAPRMSHQSSKDLVGRIFYFTQLDNMISKASSKNQQKVSLSVQNTKKQNLTQLQVLLTIHRLIVI